ncbi:MAG TPA: aspartate/glutamate racemase family protein [Methanocorpusculum sp.]|nr:aspartate/glutamate racemase family protein [Methanocorpusculum sp.]
MEDKKEITLLDIVPVTAQGILSELMISDMEKYLMPGTKAKHVQISEGPITIECEYDEAFAAPEVVKKAAAEYQQGNIDGIFVNCFGDPGVRATRENIAAPVFGGFEPAIHLALGLGDKIGIVTVLKNVVPMISGAVSRAGLEKRVISIRTLNIPVLQLENHDLLMNALYAECKKAIEEDGVEVLVMGCTGIVGIDEEMKTKLLADGYDVPVLEAGACAMTLTELYARMGLKPSRLTYMKPPIK